MLRPMQGLALLLLALWLAGCAGGVRTAPPEYRQHFKAAPEPLLAASMAALAARDMVIVYGDQRLGEVRAHHAARPPLIITARVEAHDRHGSSLVLTGRRGGAAVGVSNLALLATDIAERLEASLQERPLELNRKAPGSP